MSVTAAEWIQGYLTMQEKILELEMMVPDSEDHIYVTPVTFTNMESYIYKFYPNKIMNFDSSNPNAYLLETVGF